MSLNINKAMLGVTDAVVLHVNTDKLGNRQLAAYKRACKTGIIRGFTPYNAIVKTLREKHNLPIVHIGRYGHLSWYGVGEEHTEQFFTPLLAAITAERLAHVPSISWMGKDYQLERIKSALEMVAPRPSEGQLYGYGGLARELVPTLKFPPCEPELGIVKIYMRY